MPDGQPVSPTGVPARPGRPRWKRVLLIGTAVFAALIVLGAAGLFVVYKKLDGNLTTLAIDDKITGDRPSAEGVAQDEGDGQPLNILVMGSDTRVGQGDQFEGDLDELGDSQRSDTTFLLHVAGDRSRATAVSFPRDLLVDIPSCVDSQGDTTKARNHKMFNSAFEIGGPACTLQTVEQLTGVFVDHFVVVDFAGFTEVVDALDGVDVCLTEPVRDRNAGLRLPAGVTTVRGEQALAFVRSRDIDPTADIGRIQRQQAFMSSMIQKLQSNGTLLNPVKLFSVLDAATSSLTTDPGLGSLNELRKLAQQMSGIPLEDITFLTIPWEPSDESGRLEVDEDSAEQVFAALQADQPWPPVEGTPTPTPSASPSPSPSASNPFADLTIAPEDVSVTVLNAAGTPGAAAAAAELLRDAGFNVVKTGDAPAGSPKTTRIVAGSERQDSLKTLAAAVPSATTAAANGVSATTLTLYVGTDFAGVQDVELPSSTTRPSSSRTPSASPGATEVPETAAVVTADTNVCESIGRTLD